MRRLRPVMHNQSQLLGLIWQVMQMTSSTTILTTTTTLRGTKIKGENVKSMNEKVLNFGIALLKQPF